MLFCVRSCSYIRHKLIIMMNRKPHLVLFLRVVFCARAHILFFIDYRSPDAILIWIWISDTTKLSNELFFFVIKFRFDDPQVRRKKVLSSVSPLEASGGDPKRRGLLFRFAAEQTEDAREMLHDFLMPLKEDLGGRAPYSRDGHCYYHTWREDFVPPYFWNPARFLHSKSYTNNETKPGKGFKSSRLFVHILYLGSSYANTH